MTMLRAGRYSLSFCWRNAKRLTAKRIILSTVITVLSYVAIFANGFLFNTVQTAITNHGSGDFMTEFQKSRLLSPMLLILGIFLLMRMLGSYNGQLRGNWSQTLRFANQRELQEHRATLDVATIRNKEYDDLFRRISELPNGWGLRISFSEEVLGLLTTFATFITFGSSLLWYNPYYALVILLTSIPMIVVEFKLAELWWNLFYSLTPEHKKRSVLERPYHGMINFVQAKMFNQMPSLRKKIDINVGAILDKYNFIRKTSIKKRFWVNSLTILGLMGVILHASWSVISESGGIGTLTIIIGAARTFQGSLENFVGLISDQWNNSKGVLLIEEEFLNLKPTLKTDYPVIPPKDITPEIVFDNVSFKYPNTERTVLENVSFTIKAGTKVAIVGASGNGKSTVQALLMRYYDPTSGNVFAGGINLRKIRPSDWSEVASALTQEYVVLDRLIGEEIASSRLDEEIDMNAVEASTRFANFDSVVASDPEGLNAQIGTEFGGREFSGGEKQRLALARVHYRGTPILILDEPDAKLDAVSAQTVIDNMFALEGVTVVLITHHISHAERCDHIIVMGKGKVAEQGTHEELLALNGTYVSIREKDRERLLGGHLGSPS